MIEYFVEQINLILMRFFIIFFLFLNVNIFLIQSQPLSIGQKLPEFSLPGIDGKQYTNNDFNSYTVLVIVFISNICPTSQAYEDRIIALAEEFSDRNVGFMAISPNNPHALSYEDQSYSEFGDSFNEMILRSKDKGYNFPFLYDGDKQEVSKAFGPAATPHIFVFDTKRILRYQGRIDNIENPYKEPTSQEARSAILAVLAGIDVLEETTKVFGCPVRWEKDIEIKNKIDNSWNKKPVKIREITNEGLIKLLGNYNDNIALIYIYSLNDSSLYKDMDALVEIHRRYNSRFFEVITVRSGDKDMEVFELLEKQHAAFQNYYCREDIKHTLINSSFQGRYPFILLIEPEGKILKVWEGPVEPLTVKKTIIEIIGRFYAND